MANRTPEHLQTALHRHDVRFQFLEGHDDLLETGYNLLQFNGHAVTPNSAQGLGAPPPIMTAICIVVNGHMNEYTFGV